MCFKHMVPEQFDAPNSADTPGFVRDRTSGLYVSIENKAGHPKQAFIDFFENEQFHKEIPHFFASFWSIPVTEHEANHIYDFCISVSSMATQSYEYTFHTIMIYISSFNQLLAKLSSLLGRR